MAYTPELTQKDSGALRRIAWALGLPMTKTLNRILDHTGMVIDKKLICAACLDNSFCPDCFAKN